MNLKDALCLSSPLIRSVRNTFTLSPVLLCSDAIGYLNLTFHLTTNPSGIPSQHQLFWYYNGFYFTSVLSSHDYSDCHLIFTVAWLLLFYSRNEKFVVSWLSEVQASMLLYFISRSVCILFIRKDSFRHHRILKSSFRTWSAKVKNEMKTSKIYWQ